MERLNIDEYKKIVGNSNPRKTSSLCKNNAADDVCKHAIQALQSIQNLGLNNLFTGRIRLSIDVVGKSTADADNILKGIADGLQGIAFENDKQIREASIRMCDS